MPTMTNGWMQYVRTGGSYMRGDQKWPPEEYKKQSEIDNEERLRLAAGPACRPRLVHKVIE